MLLLISSAGSETLLYIIKLWLISLSQIRLAGPKKLPKKLPPLSCPAVRCEEVCTATALLVPAFAALYCAARLPPHKAIEHR